MATLAGAFIGLGVWWLTGRSVPWYVFAGPLAVFGLAAAAFERFVGKNVGRMAPRE